MNPTSTEPTAQSTSPDRRRGVPPAPRHGELLIESGWRPTDKPSRESEGWLRAHGYAPDRRTK